MITHVKKLVAITCLSLAAATLSARVVRVGASVPRTAAPAHAMLTPPAPGALSFSSASYAVTEEAGSAKVSVKRAGGTDGEVVGKVTLTDVSTTPADYRLTPGARDTSFNQGGAGADNYVEAVALQPDGKILIGGDFTSYNGDESAPDHIMRLNADGTRDASFNPGGSGADTNSVTLGQSMHAVALQPDGRIIIGGSFRSYNGDESAPDRVMRLNADGTRDASFNPGGSGAGGGITAGGTINEVVLQPDGRIIIGGDFTSYNGDESAPDHVMRLNADGTRDASFNPGGSGASGPIVVVALQSNGKIIIGPVSGYNDSPVASVNVIRLNADGAHDTSFKQSGTGVDRLFAAVAQPDGKVIIAGTSGARIARLNADGARDASFNPGGLGPEVQRSDIPLHIPRFVDMVALQPDGKIFIAGSFASYNGDESAPDGFMRLNADGTFDRSFKHRGGTGIVAVALQPDGQIVVVGNFDTYDGDASAPDRVARVDGDLFVTWRDGDAAEKLIRLPIIDDGIAEGDETLTLALSAVSGGAALGAPPSATLTIGGPRSPIDDGSNFVRQHYYDFLSREPDAEGLAFWSGQTTNCGSPNVEVCRVNVSAAFFLSIEFRQTGYLVERIYKVAYGDATGVSTLGGPHQLSVPAVRFSEFVADTPLIGDGVIVGQGDWPARLEANKVAYAQNFVRRQRFRDVYDALAASPTQYVDRLNSNAGGVVADPDERAGLVNEAAEGTDEARASVLRKIAEHPELDRREKNRAFVLMQFFGYLRRNPDTEPDADHTGYEFWLRKLDDNGGDFRRAEMVKAFINSAEYRRRFAQ